VYGKPVNQGITQLKASRNLRNVAEERAGRRLGGLRVLNSYWVNEVRASLGVMAIGGGYCPLQRGAALYCPILGDIRWYGAVRAAPTMGQLRAAWGASGGPIGVDAVATAAATAAWSPPLLLLLLLLLPLPPLLLLPLPPLLLPLLPPLRSGPAALWFVKH
jgi:hypothetical protein